MRPSGFSLWDLLCAVAVGGVVLGVGVPQLGRFVLGSERMAEVNAFVAAVQLARSESAKRARPVVLCKTADRRRCGGDALRYDAGWMVFVNADGARPPQRAADEPLLLARRPRAHARITANRTRFEFRPYRRRSTNGTVTFCDRRGESAARAVIISYTGRPRVADTGPGRPLSCAEGE